jgi:hypothetical protein
MARTVGVETGAQGPVKGQCLREGEIEEATRPILQADAQRHVHIHFFCASPLVSQGNHCGAMPPEVPGEICLQPGAGPHPEQNAEPAHELNAAMDAVME